MDPEKRLKVLHLIDSGGVYGAEMMLLDLMDEQQRCGLDPILGSIRNRRSEPKDIEVEASRRGHRVMSWPLKWGIDIAGARRISAYAIREGIELLHTHGYKANIHVGAIIRYVLKGVPWVVTLHGWTSIRKMSRLELYEYLDSKFIRLADRIVLVSPEMYNSTRLHGIDCSRMEVIPNGIQCAPDVSLNDDAQEIVQFCRTGFVVGSVGRLSEEKNYGILVEAVGELVKSGVNARLVIVGDGDERTSMLELAARHGMKDRLLLPGYLKNARRCLKLFHIFALASLTEGLPISVLEAMAAGVPVVAPDVGSIREVLEEGSSGVIYPAGDRRMLMESMRILASDPDSRNKIAERARDRVAIYYSAAFMASRYENVYRSVKRLSRNDKCIGTERMTE